MAVHCQCPKCQAPVTIPEGFADDAVVRCPLCSEEYPLAEAMEGAPPVLEVIDPGSTPAAPITAMPAPEAAAAVAATEGLEGLPGAEPAESDVFAFATTETPVTEDPFAGFSTEESAGQMAGIGGISTGSTTTTATNGKKVARKKRKKKSLKSEVIGIVIGGLMAPVLVYGILYAINYFKEEQVGMKLYMPGIAHTEKKSHMGYTTFGPMFGVDTDGTADDADGKKDPPKEPKDSQQATTTDGTGGDASTDEEPPLGEGYGEGEVEFGFDDLPPIEELQPLDNGTAPSPANSGTGDAGTDEPVPVVSGTNDPHPVENDPLTAALFAVNDADPSAPVDDAVYKLYCKLADEVDKAEGPKVDEQLFIVQQDLEVLGEKTDLIVIGRLANQKRDAPKPKGGILFAGRVFRVVPADSIGGTMEGIMIQLAGAPNNEKSLVVLNDTSAAFSEGDGIIGLGKLIANPKDNIDGFTASTPLVAVARVLVIMSQ